MVIQGMLEVLGTGIAVDFVVEVRCELGGLACFSYPGSETAGGLMQKQLRECSHDRDKDLVTISIQLS